MSFTSLLRHRVQIRRPVHTEVAGVPQYDELGHPVTAMRALETVATRIEPLSNLQSREVALLSQSGAVIADHRFYMLAGTDVRTSDQLVPQPSDGRVFEVARIDDLGGAGRYLELQALLVTSAEVEPS